MVSIFRTSLKTVLFAWRPVNDMSSKGSSLLTPGTYCVKVSKNLTVGQNCNVTTFDRIGEQAFDYVL